MSNGASDGTHPQLMTDGSGSHGLPIWSPDPPGSWSLDGKWLAFASSRGGFKDEAVSHPQTRNLTDPLSGRLAVSTAFTYHRRE